MPPLRFGLSLTQTMIKDDLLNYRCDVRHWSVSETHLNHHRTGADNFFEPMG